MSTKKRRHALKLAAAGVLALRQEIRELKTLLLVREEPSNPVAKQKPLL